MASQAFLRVKLTFGQADDASSAAGDEMSIEMFKYTIITAVQNMYGQVGRAAIDPDVLSYDAPTCVAVLAVDDRSYRPLWAALTLLGQYDGRRCRFEVMDVTPDLASLAVAVPP